MSKNTLGYNPQQPREDAERKDEKKQTNSPSVLIVDDDRFLVKTFELLLRNAGFKVQVAADGEEALTKASAEEFDLAIVDYYLPDTSGDELSIKLKSLQSELSVIILTGQTDLEDAGEGLEVLFKPIDPEKLIEKADRLRTKL